MRGRLLGLAGLSAVSFTLHDILRLDVRAEEIKQQQQQQQRWSHLSKPLDLREQKPQRECVLVVGTTGSGKSSTIAKYTGQQVKVGDRPESVTKFCQLYADELSPGGSAASRPVWVDTVGYDDTNNLSDEESFREVLRFLNDENLTSVRAVLWTVLPQERKDARLQKQADFINQFREGDIWKNVIILVKQPGSFNIDRAGQGALEAARAYTSQPGQVQLLGFTYLDSLEHRPQLATFLHSDTEKRREMLILDDEEVRAHLDAALANIQEPVQVIFVDSECEACGVVGDRRLLPDFCHMEQQEAHSSTLRHLHPSPVDTYHPLHLESHHPGVLQLVGGPHQNCETVRNYLAAGTLVGLLEPFTGITLALGAAGTHYLCSQLSKPQREAFSCCSGDKNSAGCQLLFPCCRRREEGAGCCYKYPCCDGGIQAPGCTRRYKCCEGEESSPGCGKVCRKCGQPWGSPAGRCFAGPHTLTRPVDRD